jgi:hypothetical protein
MYMRVCVWVDDTSTPSLPPALPPHLDDVGPLHQPVLERRQRLLPHQQRLGPRQLVGAHAAGQEGGQVVAALARHLLRLIIRVLGLQGGGVERKGEGREEGVRREVGHGVA